jgi:glucose-6-phosphate 1-dehydrogenase
VFAEEVGRLRCSGGDLMLFVREAEESWRIVDPVMRAWSAGHVPIQDYPPEPHRQDPPGDQLK